MRSCSSICLSCKTCALTCLSLTLRAQLWTVVVHACSSTKGFKASSFGNSKPLLSLLVPATSKRRPAQRRRGLNTLGTNGRCLAICWAPTEATVADWPAPRLRSQTPSKSRKEVAILLLSSVKSCQSGCHRPMYSPHTPRNGFEL